MITFSQPESKCNFCQSKLDRHTTSSERLPEKGDIAICSSCGEIAEFDEDLNIIHSPQIEEIKTSDPDFYNQLLEIQKIVRKKLTIREKLTEIRKNIETNHL